MSRMALMGCLFALLVGTISPSASAMARPFLAVYGGESTQVSDFEFMASLRTPLSMCGATLVAPDWALTATHCVAGAAPDEVTLRFGVEDLYEDDGVVTTGRQIVVAGDSDLALVQLNDPNPNFVPVQLATRSMEASWAPGTEATAIGWGKTTDDGPLPNILQRANLQLDDDASCAAFDDPSVICAGGSGTGVCRGDSGGPLFQTIDGVRTQIGVTSYGMYCGSVGGFIEIAHYHDWIMATVGDSYSMSVRIATTCAPGGGITEVTVVNDAPYAQNVEIAYEGFQTRGVEVQAHSSAVETFDGQSDGKFAAQVRLDGAILANTVENVVCSFSEGGKAEVEPEPLRAPIHAAVEVTESCWFDGGRLDVALTNPDENARSFIVRFGGEDDRAVELAPGSSGEELFTELPDGRQLVIIEDDNGDLLIESITVSCDDTSRQFEPVEVETACLAGRGRIGVNVVNDGDDAADYVVRVGPQSRRTTTIAAQSDARLTFAGRRDGDARVTVRRDGELIYKTAVSVSCGRQVDR